MTREKILRRIISEKLHSWVNAHYLQLAVFNIFLLFLVLLRSAGYFEPFLSLTINLITMVSLVLITLLFNSKSGFMFLVAAFFWVGSAILRILGVEVWAERTAIYTVQALLLGIILLVIENTRVKK